ncbi:MAG: hypothetical protein E7511_06890 [Ruminococcus sp.]|nr:hypothetical protein [Ruminococcus sp.]
MLTEKSVYAYRVFFNTNDCAFAEPGNQIVVSDENGKTYISPFTETDEQFTDRLERCQQTGHNLFFEEWDEFEYKKGMIY